MGKSVRVLSGVAIAVASVFVGLAAPAGAHTSLRASSAISAHAAAVPNTNIKGAGATAAFKPASLKVHWGAATPQPACTPALTSFTISNPTKAPVQITFNGKNFGKKLKPNFLEGVCLWGTGKAKGAFGLKGSTNTLTVKVS